MHDGSSPAGRERSSSLQGMDMASLPPRKRPWQDGPGTGDPRERESPGADGGKTSRRVYMILQVLVTPEVIYIHIRGLKFSVLNSYNTYFSLL